MIGLVDGNNFFVSCERVMNPALRGKPVGVLSSNDGCVVALSPELKALGVTRGMPHFKLRELEASKGVVFVSSNFALYGDLSSRMISVLKENAWEVEQYSVDEAFLYPHHPKGKACDEAWYMDYGRMVRSRVLRCVGIPCGIGFAPTKTLAKIADHIAKKTPEGVYVLPSDPSSILAKLPVREVWGVGRRLEPKLRAERIFTALDLRDASDDDVRSLGGVTLLRTVLELRGTACLEDIGYNDTPESISCSRCFGENVSTLSDITESLASFTAQAAEKLRENKQLASGCTIYVQVAKAGMFDNVEELRDSVLSRTVIFPHPTDSTAEMLSAISKPAESLFSPTLRYRKSGMCFLGLEDANKLVQDDLFEGAEKRKRSRLFEIVDNLNRRYGASCVRVASQGINNDAKWRNKHELRSPDYTGNWDELPHVL